jgi:uncharacterized protein (TIGR02466 family)
MFNIKCRSIFPTDLYFVNIYDQKENESYRKELIRLSQIEAGNVRSNRNGYQSDITLWKNEVFNPLLEKSSAIVQSIIADLSTNQQEFVIRSMWGNIHPKGGFNFTHVHPTGWLSAVYYVALPEGCPGITFEDPRPSRLMDFQHSCLVDNLYYNHQPQVGQLVLFPSWLPHFVNPNPVDENRISISFNVELLV